MRVAARPRRRRVHGRARRRTPGQGGSVAFIGNDRNWWSCIHVDDLAGAFLTTLERAQPGAAYAIVDDESHRLRELTDLVTDAMGGKRVGTAPPRLIALLIGGTRVASLTTSFRMRGTRIREELGWTPQRLRFRDHVEETVAAMT